MLQSVQHTAALLQDSTSCQHKTKQKEFPISHVVSCTNMQKERQQADGIFVLQSGLQGHNPKCKLLEQLASYQNVSALF